MTRYLPSFIKNYKKECCIALLMVLNTVFALSLYFYSPTDSSWFFYSTSSMPIHNIFGSFGAFSAALLLHIFGATAWFFLAMLFFVTYVLFVERSWRREWDRLSAFIVLILTSSALLYVYTIGHHQGGLLGVRVYNASLMFFDQLSALLLLYVLSLAAFIIIGRDVLVITVRATLPIIQFLCSKRFWTPIYGVLSWTLYIISRPFVHLVGWLKSIADGSVVHNERESIIEFEQAIVHADHHTDHVDKAAWYEDQLWKEYLQSEAPDVSPKAEIKSESVVSESKEDVLKKETKETKETIEYTQPAGALKKQDQLYTLPNPDIFIGVDDESDDQQLILELEQRAKILEEKLERFGVSGKVVSIKRGPVVTLFEYRPHIDSKISKIIALEDDLALALQALSIRIIAPIPGRSVVGFEVANKHRKGVFLAGVVQSPIFTHYSGALPLALGQDTIGNTVIVDLARMPHLLIAGSTGSGKSVALNAMLVSLLCKLSPDQLRLILVDPKRLEFASYADIAHLLFPIVTNPKEAAPILRWVVRTMEERYECMAKFGVRSIDDYNRTIGVDQEPIPYIVVIIDELSDLMMTAGKEIEDLIARITQMARAAGIHMIVATQRPSVDVITGLIKVNFPSRISFRVTSKIDSRTILDCGGADKLLGRGDMLFLDSCEASLRRIHGAYVSDREIEELVEHIRQERPTDYLDISQELPANDDLLHEGDDALYQEISSFLDATEEVSISLLQRKFRIGYNRSARIIDKLESQGLIEPSTGGKTRKVMR